MRHKVKHVHFVGIGGAAMSREQGPAGLLADRARLQAMAGAAHRLARPGATAAVAEVCMAAAGLSAGVNS